MARWRGCTACLTALTMVVGAAGCGDGVPSREEVIQDDLRTLRMSLRSTNMDRAEDGSDEGYRYVQQWETTAIQFLEDNPPLERPHALACVLVLPAVPRPGDVAILQLNYVEYGTPSLGILLGAMNGEDAEPWLLPVFAHDDWFPDTEEIRRTSTLRERRIGIQLTHDSVPGVVAFVQPGNADPSDVWIQLPIQLAGSELRLRIYNQKGLISNTIPVQVSREDASGPPEREGEEKPETRQPR